MAEKTWMPLGHLAYLDENGRNLLGALIGLARTCDSNPPTENTDVILVEGLMALRKTNIDKSGIASVIEKVNEEKFTIVPGCRYCANPCGRTSNFSFEELRFLAEDNIYLREILADKIIDASASLHRLLVPGIDREELFHELKYLIFVIGEDFTNGGLYDAISRADKLAEKADEILNNFYE